MTDEPTAAPVDGIEESVRPRIALPRQDVVGLAVAAGGGTLALVLLLSIWGHQAARTPASGAVADSPVVTPPPPLTVPPLDLPPPTRPTPMPTPTPVPPVTARYPQPVERTVTMPPPPVQTAPSYTPPSRPPYGAPPGRAGGQEQATSDPALVIDLSPGDGGATGGASVPGGTTTSGGSGGGDDATARAYVIRNRSTLVTQGTLVFAALETPLDSTRGGLVRAVISRDVRGFDGGAVLIPRGSRLLGEYRGDVQSGQKRILITWTRLVRPDGVAIRIASPAADTMGATGVKGKVNNHFLARFAGAVLQTALQVGAGLATRPGNGSVIVGLPGQMSSQAGNLLGPGPDLRPTITVREGRAVSVFVARDLDFSGVPPWR